MEHTMTGDIFAATTITAEQNGDGVNSVFVSELEKLREVDSPKPQRASFEQLNAMASSLSNRPVSLLTTPAMDLTPRKPYDSGGMIDMYESGRWDCSYNMIHMTGIKTGPNPGNWIGTVAYLQFKAPTDGTYLLVVHFSGYQTTMKLNGPWGIATAYCPTTLDTGTLTVLWTAKAGVKVFPSLTCTYPNYGYLYSVQAYKFA